MIGNSVSGRVTAEGKEEVGGLHGFSEAENMAGNGTAGRKVLKARRIHGSKEELEG